MSLQTLNLEDYRWQNRLLLVFAPGPGHARVSDVQAQVDAACEGVLDRDLLVIDAYADGTGQVDGTPLAEPAVNDLRRRFDVGADDVTVILIGKDGGVKERLSGEFDLSEVFALIDGMPMRRAETRREKPKPEC